MIGPAWANPTVVCGRQGDDASAERASGIFGTRRVAVSRHQVETRGVLLPRKGYTGPGAEAWDDVYSAHPQVLRELPRGRFFWATATSAAGRGPAEILQAVPDQMAARIRPDDLSMGSYGSSGAPALGRWTADIQARKDAPTAGPARW